MGKIPKAQSGVESGLRPFVIPGRRTVGRALIAHRQAAGQPHEVMLLVNAGDRKPVVLRPHATLEPCSHYGAARVPAARAADWGRCYIPRRCQLIEDPQLK